MALLAIILLSFLSISLSIPLIDPPLNETTYVDINRAKRLAKFSNIAYCSEKKVLNWDCVYCRESELNTFKPLKFLYGSFDAQGYIGYDDSLKEILVVFQGSVSIENWIANLHFLKLDYDYPGVSGARVHSGFYKGALSLFDSYKAILQDLLNTKPGYKVVVTGHSQGGATGAMNALFIHENFGIVPEVQTFGQPRVGNIEYSTNWKNRINQINYRYTHKRDPVPQLPPRPVGFHHHPTEVWFQDVHGSKYTVCDQSGEDPKCHNSVWLPVDIFDHLWYLDIYLGIPCN